MELSPKRRPQTTKQPGQRRNLPPTAPKAQKNNFVREVQIPETIQELIDEDSDDEIFKTEQLGEVFQNPENDNLFLI